MSGSMGQEQAAGIARELLSRKGYLIEGDAARDGHTIVATKDGERVLAVVVGGGTLTAERARALAGEHGGGQAPGATGSTSSGSSASAMRCVPCTSSGWTGGRGMYFITNVAPYWALAIVGVVAACRRVRRDG